MLSRPAHDVRIEVRPRGGLSLLRSVSAAVPCMPSLPGVTADGGLAQHSRRPADAALAAVAGTEQRQEMDAAAGADIKQEEGTVDEHGPWQQWVRGGKYTVYYGVFMRKIANYCLITAITCTNAAVQFSQVCRSITHFQEWQQFHSFNLEFFFMRSCIYSIQLKSGHFPW